MRSWIALYKFQFLSEQPLDGLHYCRLQTSFAGTIVSDEFVLGLQRRTGLYLATYAPVIKVALEAGEDVDYFG